MKPPTNTLTITLKYTTKSTLSLLVPFVFDSVVLANDEVYAD